MYIKIIKTSIVIMLLIFIQLLLNLLFYKFYPGILDYTLIRNVTLINGLVLSVILLSAYTIGLKNIQEIIQKTNLHEILYNLIQNSASQTSSDLLYQDILTAAVSSIPTATKGCVMLLGEDDSTLHFVSVEGYDADILKNTFLKLEESYLYRESNGQITKSVVIDDPFGYDRKNITSENMDEILSAGIENIMATISTPIIYDGRLHGMINVDSPIRHGFKPVDVDTIEIFAYEITNVLRLHESLKQNTYLTNHDILTGISNRCYFNEYYKNLMTKHRTQPFVLISMDLNHLKGTNDTYGHLAGDALLKQFTVGFSENIPDECCFSRYGGDEFLLLLPNLSHDDVIDLLLSVKKWFVENPFVFKDITLPIDFSYGIAHYPEEKDSLDAILHLADERMYEQKRYHHRIHLEHQPNE